MKTLKNILSKVNVFGRIKKLEAALAEANALTTLVAQAHNKIAKRTNLLVDHLELVEVNDNKRGNYLRKKRGTQTKVSKK